MTIVIKDADFSNRILQTTAPPKVIHLKIGNMKSKDFQAFIEEKWDEIESLSAENKLVCVYFDTFEVVN